MLMVCYARCSTCKKAEAWLKERGVEYRWRDIKGENPTEDELREWIKMSGLPLNRWFNTSGIPYREGKIKERRKTMTEAEQIELLATDGMLVKRPILIGDDFVLVGFKLPEWEARFG